MNRNTNFESDNNIIDQDNRARTDRLALKLAKLKNVAVDIEEESRDHIPMLDNVDNSYERTWNALSSGQNKLIGLLNFNRKGRKRFCYTASICFIIMVIIYFWLARKT